MEFGTGPRHLQDCRDVDVASTRAQTLRPSPWLGSTGMPLSAAKARLAREADTALKSAWDEAVSMSRLSSFASAFPEIKQQFGELAVQTQMWFRVYLIPETEAGYKIRRRFPEALLALAVAYGAMASAIADWEGRAIPPVQLRDALEIGLTRLWARLAEAQAVVPEPQTVIATVKKPDARCVYCNDTVTEAKSRGRSEDMLVKATGSIVVGSCEHSFYDTDEWNWLRMGGARTRVVTLRQISDVLAGIARFQMGHSERIFDFTALPFHGDDLVYYWLDVEGALGLDNMEDTDLFDTTTFAAATLALGGMLGIES